MEVERVRDKVFEERPGFPTQYGPDRTDRQPGSPLVPHETYRDLVPVLLLTAMLFFLTAAIVPSLEKPRNPAETPFIVPDWYVLFSYGLLKLAQILPHLNLPLISLVLLPFIDRGRETRPAKAPLRSAVGVSFLFVWMFFASMYSVNNLILEKWPVIGSDDVLKAFMFVPPFLAFAGTYIGLRRLGYAPMHWWRVVPLMAAFLVTLAHSLLILATIGGWSQYGLVALFLGLLTGITFVPAFAVTWLPEKNALRAIMAVGGSLVLFTLALWWPAGRS